MNIIKKNIYIILTLSFVLCLLLVGVVNAVGISVTKGEIIFGNVLKDGYAEDTFFVSTDAPFDVPLSYELGGDIKKWVTIDPDLNDPNITVTVNNTKYQPIRVVITPPADTPIGDYTGFIRIITGAINKPGGQYGTNLQAAFLVRIRISVTGTEYLSCSAGGIIIRDTEVGMPLEYYMSVSNSGNIRVRPNATVDIWNQDQTKLLTTKQLLFNDVEVLPTTSKAFTNKFGADLRVGQYWGYATVYPCETTQLVTFNVYEKGGIVDNGDFIRIDNPSWAKIGDVLPIAAVFKNLGTRTVSAKFKGVITSDNRIIETIDTEFYDVAPGEISTIQTYFTPKKLGQYIITGRILYNNKLSFEKSSVITVNEGVESQFSWIYILILIIIIIVILLLLIRIRKKKHKINRL
jgi:hypothetical protein